MKALVKLLVLMLPVAALPYESDVHYGLTRWLALKAGFDEVQANAIAQGNQRADGGMMETLALSLEYACVSKSAQVARQSQSKHYPAARAVPTRAVDRRVVAGDKSARSALRELDKVRAGKEAFLLAKLGEGLHSLQDSWSHQGVPEAPARIGSIACDDQLLSLHPTSRGGAMSHDADATLFGPADAAEMARVTYEYLTGWPAIAGKQRSPATWDSLKVPLAAFIAAPTKTAKRKWFIAQGFGDTSFLEGVSLPDGPEPGPLQWNGRRLPPLLASVSNQHEIDADLRSFFNQLLSRWLGEEKIEAVVAELGPPKPFELTARMKAWKVRDHGLVAEIAHAKAPLTPAQMRRLNQLTRDGKAFVRVAKLADAVFPLQAIAPYATPLLPYITSMLQPSGDGIPRAVAILRLRHAPYDSVAVIAQKQGTRWVLSEFVGLPDH